MNKILDKLAYGPTVFLGVVFFLMPFYPEPHLLVKAKILMGGGVMEPRDWVDVVLHSTAGLVALTKFLRNRELAKLGLVADGDRDSEPSASHDQHSDEP